MKLTGHVQNGVVVLDGGGSLPEGSLVIVSPRAIQAAVPAQDAEQTAHLPVADDSSGRVQIAAEYDAQGRLKFPLIRTGKPGTLHLTNQQIAEILDDQDAAAGR